MPRSRLTPRATRRLLPVAAALVAASTILGPAMPAGASSPATCDDNNASLCRLVAPQGVTSTGQATGSINLSRNVAMADLDFTTTTDFAIPANRTVVRSGTNFNSYVEPVAGTPITGAPLPPGISAVIVTYNPYTLRFAGTPTSAGSTTLEIQVSAAPNSPQVDSYYLTIVVTADSTAPVLQTATMPSTGDRITLTYDEALTARSIDPTSYAVTVNGNPASVSSAAASSSTVTLTLASPVEAGATVVVDYTKPGSNPVEDAAGNDAANLTSRAVTNNSTRDLTSPTLLSGSVTTSGEVLELTYDESLTARSIDPTSYAVTVDGDSVAVSSADAIGTKVSLVLAAPVEAGATVGLSYVKPGSNPVEDTSGNDAPDFASQAVTNGSTRDLTAPTLRSAAVDATGKTILMTYNETITRVQANGFVRTMAMPNAADFTVTASGQSRLVAGVTTSGSTVTLSFDTTFFTGDIVKLSYTPSTGNEIEDAAGNAAAAVSDYVVTNGSTVAAPTAPTVAGLTPTTPTATPAATTTTSTTTTTTTTGAETPKIQANASSKGLPTTGSSTPLLPTVVLLTLTGGAFLGLRRRNLKA